MIWEAIGELFPAAAVRLVIGLALIAAGVRTWIRRPRSPDERKTPSWIAGLESTGPAQIRTGSC